MTFAVVIGRFVTALKVKGMERISKMPKPTKQECERAVRTREDQR